MTRSRRISMTILATLALTLLSGGVALADHLHAVCFVEAQPSAKLDQGYTLDVRLVTTDGKPLGDATVRFYEAVDLFGKREMLIGSAITDGQGHAALSYLPAWTGSHEIVVHFPGKDHYVATEGRTTFQAEIAAQPYVVESPPLSSFSSKVPYVAGALVLGVWALIAFALIGTARAVMTAQTTKKGETA